MIILKKIFLAAWTAVCTAWICIAGTLPLLASEQASETAENTEKMLLTMDILQTVCIVIVITAVLLFVAFYILKAVLKKMHVAPTWQEQDAEHQTKEK